MRLVQHPVALILPALLLVACGDRREKEDDTSATPADQVVDPAPPAANGTADAEAGATPGTSDVVATAPPPVAEGAASQSEALGLLATANEHEVAAADQAIAKKVTGDVLAFANMMKTEHGKNLAETTALGATPETARITQMRSKGEADLAALEARSGTEYEQAWIDAMVKGHTEVLALLDSTLIPAATDAAVKTHFADTRAAVAKHLEEARKLKAGE